MANHSQYFFSSQFHIEPLQDPAQRIQELRELLAKKDSELNQLRSKAVEFQTRLDRVSKLLPQKDNK